MRHLRNLGINKFTRMFMSTRKQDARTAKTLSCIWTAFLLGSQNRSQKSFLLADENKLRATSPLDRIRVSRRNNEQAATLFPDLSVLQ